METLLRHRVPGFDYKDWTKKPRLAADGDVSETIGSEDGVTVLDADTREHVLTFLPVTERPMAPLLEAVRGLRYQENYRTEGLKSRSCTFGFQPRIPLRRDYCSVAAAAYKHPAEHKVLIEYGRWTSRIYQRYLPSLYDQQQAELLAVRSEWKEPDTHFTSGIANDRNVLHYHRDAGNFPNALSTMLSLARNMGETGGKLLIPEYSIGLEFHGFELLIFNGSALVHGVTPITIHSPETFRFTVVYYALQAMCRCESKQDELNRIRRIKTKRERQRAGENNEQLKQRMLADVGVSEEDMKRLGERRETAFKTRTIKKRKP